MKLKFSNSSATDELRVRIVPKNGKSVSKSAAETNPTVGEQIDGSLTFCLSTKAPDPILLFEIIKGQEPA